MSVFACGVCLSMCIHTCVPACGVSACVYVCVPVRVCVCLCACVYVVSSKYAPLATPGTHLLPLQTPCCRAQEPQGGIYVYKCQASS